MPPPAPSATLAGARARRAVLAGGLLLGLAGRAAPELPTAPTQSGSSGWHFELLPKAFQKNPLVDMTVITEMTDAGRKRPPATPADPVYFLTYVTPEREEGELQSGNRPPSPAVIEQAVVRALATNHFLPADARHPASLVLIVHFGVFNRPGELADDVGNRNAIARAALVGGEKFANDYRRALLEQNQLDAMGTIIPLFSPVKRFKERDTMTERLYNLAAGDLYFAVASAYDLVQMAHGKRVLLWRTRMTVDPTGVTMADTLRAVIAASAPYLGRDMPAAVTLYQHAVREGRVEVGPVKVEQLPAESAPPPVRR